MSQMKKQKQNKRREREKEEIKSPKNTEIEMICHGNKPEAT